MDSGDGQNLRDFKDMNTLLKTCDDTGISIIVKKKTWAMIPHRAEELSGRLRMGATPDDLIPAVASGMSVHSFVREGHSVPSSPPIIHCSVRCKEFP
jgi:hypothetical protein